MVKSQSNNSTELAKSITALGYHVDSLKFTRCKALFVRLSKDSPALLVIDLKRNKRRLSGTTCSNPTYSYRINSLKGFIPAKIATLLIAFRAACPVLN